MDTFTEPLTDTEIGASPTTSAEPCEATSPVSETGSPRTPKTLAAALMGLQKTAAENPRPAPTPSEPWRAASLVQLIADEAPRPDVVDSTDGESTRKRWRPPPSLTPEQVAELPALIARGQRSILPAGAEVVGTILLKLIAVHPTGERAGTDLMMDTYVEHLSDLPADLLDGAGTQWIRTQRFFPTIAELRGLAMPELAKRKKFLERLLILRGVAELPAPNNEVTFAWLTDRRADGRRGMNALVDPRLRVAA